VSAELIKTAVDRSASSAHLYWRSWPTTAKQINSHGWRGFKPACVSPLVGL